MKEGESCGGHHIKIRVVKNDSLMKKLPPSLAAVHDGGLEGADDEREQLVSYILEQIERRLGEFSNLEVKEMNNRMARLLRILESPQGDPEMLTEILKILWVWDKESSGLNEIAGENPEESVSARTGKNKCSDGGEVIIARHPRNRTYIAFKITSDGRRRIQCGRGFHTPRDAKRACCGKK